MVFQLRNDPEFQVGKGAHGQRQLALDDIAHQCRFFHRPIAVIDAIDIQLLDRLPDIFGRTFLASMGDQSETFCAARREKAFEFWRRVS